MIFCTSLINKSTFSTSEEKELINYVINGGTLIAPRIENDRLFDLFGIEGYESSKLRHEINWAQPQYSTTLKYINEPEEHSVSLGRSEGEIFKTLGYITTSAESIAHFSDGSTAVTQNEYGAGKAISIGLSWKDVILRNQINRDYEAQRYTSNGFEPTTDVFMLFIRSLYSANNLYTVWKNTSPENSKSILMITHDVDSKTGMDSLNIFVDYEHSQQIEATYNITLKYFEDALSSDFYNNTKQELNYILEKGQNIQSHSVGHFFDFADDDIIPKGSSGNTKSNYNPYNDGEMTTNATVYAECEVSKNELENDFGIDIHTFRAGHLAYPKDLIEVLEDLGYEYNSSYSACDVLTNFPYQNVIGRSFSQRLSSIYEFPVTISDVFSNDPISSTNYIEKADIWIETALKNMDNGAPTMLLIHPNRTYKLDGLRHLLDGLVEQNIEIMEIGKYGDFWKSRKAFNFTSHLENETLTITIPSAQYLTDGVSLIIDNGQDLENLILQNDLDENISYTQNKWNDNDVVIFFGESLTNTTSAVIKSEAFKVFPNPTVDQINISCDENFKALSRLSIKNISGKTLFSQRSLTTANNKNVLTLELSSINIPPGIYFITLEDKIGQTNTQKFIMQ